MYCQYEEKKRFKIKEEKCQKLSLTTGIELFKETRETLIYLTVR